MTDEKVSIESILAGAEQAGLPLSEEDAAELVKGVARMREMAKRVRELLSVDAEPAVVFSSVQGAG